MPHPGAGHRRHLRDYWLVIRERIWLVLTCFVLVVGAGAVFTWLQDTIYRAQAKVELQVQAPNPLGNIDEGTQPGRSIYFKESFFQTQFENIRSRDLLRLTLEEHDLLSKPPFKEAVDPVGRLYGMVQLDIIPNTDVISIAADSQDPLLAAEVANAVAQTYVDWNVERRISTLLRTKENLQESLAAEVGEYSQLGVEAIEKAQKRGLATPEMQQTLTEDNIKQLRSDLREVETEVQRAEAALGEARQALDQPDKSLSVVGLQSDNLTTLARRRSELREDLKAQRSIYKDEHPEVQTLLQTLTQTTNELIGGLESHLSSLQAQERNLREALRRETQMANKIAQEMANLQGTVIQRESREKLLERISERLDELSVLATKDLLINQAQIIEKAQPPSVPIRPNVTMNMLVAFLLGGLVSVGAAFFLDYLDVSIKTVEDVEKGLDQNVLCTIPAETKKSKPLVEESIQSLRTALLFADKAKPTTTVLFTSATPKEGKSTTVVRLARALAAGGSKTIVLDCDFRLPTLSHHFQVSRDKGLSSYLLDEEGSWRQHVHADAEPNLDLFTTGPLPPNPTDLLVSPRLTQLLALLSNEYDWVLVDSPPVTSMSDAVLLSDRVDGLVFVTRYDHVDQRTAGRALAALEAVGARILGVVLNAVDTRQPGYRDYFYGRYAYYGEARRKAAEEDQPQLQPVSGGS